MAFLNFIRKWKENKSIALNDFVLAFVKEIKEAKLGLFKSLVGVIKDGS